MSGFLISVSTVGELEAIQMFITVGMERQNIVEAHNEIKCRPIFTKYVELLKHSVK